MHYQHKIFHDPMEHQHDKSWIILYQVTCFIFVLLCYIRSAMILGSKYAVSCLEEQLAIGWIKRIPHISPMKHFRDNYSSRFQLLQSAF